ncbi:TylF/MycF/NovP-related O-methyltransferase [Pantanalinema sp. GBBB05]|uniref:TylF/MycF/NovP-related O-methyltransferase n=1 Tax=Pantanalinema sp. GBBB05 TaxID=2604139 RepID=UPI001D3FE797|nr:macrocin O-methyltransferase [Pantanalinema sp. GBBB05]
MVIQTLRHWIKQQLLLTANDGLLRKVQPYTLSDCDRLQKLTQLAQYVNQHNIPGDFVECGVYKGGSAAVISNYLGEQRHLWLYDSFAGMPATSEKDSEAAKEYIGGCLSSIEDVKQVMERVGTKPSQYTIKPGWFNQTFQDKLPSQVALLHCDADWYDSVTLVLQTFYPLIPEGGCVILDDFGYWEGCREAFYDFCRQHNEKPILERVTNSQAYWIKGKQHNREGYV